MSDRSLSRDDQLAASRRLVERLTSPACYPHPVDEIRVIETHISWVILTGPFAYKLKKPCRLDFLDYSTLASRRHSCAEEVRVSGRFAPELYVAAVPITGSIEVPRVAGDGPAIEWAVKLVQFDEADRLDARFETGRLSAADCRRLGAAIAEVEAGLAVADPATPWGTADSVQAAVAINLRQIRIARPDAAEQVDRIAAWLESRLASAAPLIERRRAAGRIRECHGDLHLANLVLHAGRMTAFDAIEFSPALRWIDVANDVAFLMMDLEARGRPELAAEVRSAWMEAADDHGAAAVLRVYEVYRAVVRASVRALQDSADPSLRAETDRYLEVAERLMRPVRPVLVVTSGVSGSGKSTLAARLIGPLTAVCLRSDVERKRLAGLQPTERPADVAAEARVYGEGMTRRVYERLADVAAGLLDAGVGVVIDAACNRRWQRDLLTAVAVRRGVPLTWLEFDPPEADVLARVAARQVAGTDASDASPAVVRRQLREREPLTADEVVAGGSGVGLIRPSTTDLLDPGFCHRVALAAHPSTTPTSENPA